ncbi:hypothetical protein CO046_04750 [Candidatus Peregrinibacteria bacterium CG_4_9_14_0_2_um_filter_53_11]|nr:MAG: hypothetical protein CO046_04750 [Candidatus Peregrinibacteria bacterium CG_4_9_14_0_2_um_filter_53_11]
MDNAQNDGAILDVGAALPIKTHKRTVRGAQEDLRSERVEELVAQAQAEDSTSFGELYDLFVDPIYRYVYYRVQVEEVEDLTELVFLKAWENIRQYRREKFSFSAWIFRIAHNIVVDFYRMQKHTTQELPDQLPDTRHEYAAQSRAHRRIKREALDEALDELKDDYKTVLVLKYMNGLNNDEIALIMARSQPALRILQFRALRQLRNVLEKRGISGAEM